MACEVKIALIWNIFTIILDKHKGNHTNKTININQKEIKAVAKVKLLGMEIDDELNFNHHISTTFVNLPQTNSTLE